MVETFSSVRHDSPLRQYLGFVKRRGWLIVLVPVLAVAVSVYKDRHTPRLYRASMDVLVAQAGGTFQPQVGNQPLTQTMTNIIASDVIAQRVVDRLHLAPMTSADLLAGLKVAVKPNSSVLQVTYDSRHKQKALAVLDGVAQVFRTLIQEKLGISGSLKQPGPLLIVANVFNPPHLEPAPVSPKPKKDAIYAGALGLALGLVLAFARESFDDRIRGRRDAEDAFGAPVIGTLPKGLARKPRLAIRSRRRSRRRAAEAIQLLRANVQLTHRSATAGHTVLVTSAGPDEGKTTLAANLGAALALSGKDVICVEADMSRPKLYACFDGVKATQGLAEVIEDGAGLEDVLQEVELAATASKNGKPSGNGAGPGSTGHAWGRLFVLAAGRAPADPATALSAENVRDLVQRLSMKADYVILEAPPLLSAEAFPLALNAHDVLVVARQGRTTRESARAVRSTLERLGSLKVSVVLAGSRGRPGSRA